MNNQIANLKWASYCVAERLPLPRLLAIAWKPVYFCVDELTDPNTIQAMLGLPAPPKALPNAVIYCCKNDYGQYGNPVARASDDENAVGAACLLEEADHLQRLERLFSDTPFAAVALGQRNNRTYLRVLPITEKP